VARQVPQAREVLSSDGRACLDLHRYDSAIRCLDHGVNLELVLRPVVEEVDPGIGPGRLTGQFHLDEAFE